MLEAYVCNRATNALKRGNDVHGVLRRVERMTGRPWASLTSNLHHHGPREGRPLLRHYFLVFCVWDFSETCFVIDAAAREGRGLVFVTYFDVDTSMFEGGGTVAVGRLKSTPGGGWAFVAEDCLAASGTPLGRHRHQHRLRIWHDALRQHHRPSYADAFSLLSDSREQGLKAHHRPLPPRPPPPPPPRTTTIRAKARPFDGRLVKCTETATGRSVERMLYLEPSPSLPDIYDMYETPSPHARAVGMASVQTLESSRRLRHLFGASKGKRVLVRCRYDAARNKWEPLADDASVASKP